MDDELARAQVREWLDQLEPAERTRLIELFRQQLGLPPVEWEYVVEDPQGLPRMKPSAGAAKA